MQGVEPYNFDSDPRGLIQWYASTAEWVQANPLQLSFANPGEFRNFVTSIIDEFQNFVENNRGWSLLWNENETPKREEASQLLFLGIVKHYCAANNVDILKEVNIGRGPVDFKVSSGFECRALIEVKLAKNSKFWRGIERQLPKYLQAERVSDGRFVVIVLDERDLDRILDIEARARAINKKTYYDISPVVVDAQRAPLSASRL